MRVLVIDENPNTRGHMIDNLSEWGYQAMTGQPLSEEPEDRVSQIAVLEDELGESRDRHQAPDPVMTAAQKA